MTNNVQIKTDINNVIKAMTTFSKNNDIYLTIFNEFDFPLIKSIMNTIQTTIEQSHKLNHRIKYVNNKQLTKYKYGKIINLILLLNNNNINRVDYEFGTTALFKERLPRECFNIILDLQYSDSHDTIKFINEEFKIELQKFLKEHII